MRKLFDAFAALDPFPPPDPPFPGAPCDLGSAPHPTPAAAAAAGDREGGGDAEAGRRMARRLYEVFRTELKGLLPRSVDR